METMQNQPGFTLIELIVVVILLGIIAIVVIPQYFNLSTEAQSATTNAVAGSLSSANSINYGTRQINSLAGVAITNCTDVISTLVGSSLPVGYSVVSATVSVDTAQLCTLNGPKSTSGVFTATGIS